MKESLRLTKLTAAQVNVLHTRGLVDRATLNNAVRSFHGDHGHVGQRAIQTCEAAIEALVERAIDAACASIQDKLGVKTGDLAAATLSDGVIERELTRYVYAELEAASSLGPFTRAGRAAAERAGATIEDGET
jgi:hypothetical protein